MSLLEKAQAHYSELISGDLRSVHVPEWDETIYFRPSQTLAQNSKMLRLQNQNKPDEALVEAFIAHARDADGKRICNPADKVTLLRKVDQNVLTRVVNEMLGEPIDEETAEKNSETT